PNSSAWNSIFDQEKLPSAYTVDLRFGKSFNLSKVITSLPGRVLLNVSLGVNNLLNNTDIITSGFEQLRYDFLGHNPNKYPTKYIYGLGRTYVATVSLKF
ncbi:MAG: hypothetical protein WCG87_11145, partial [Bacteroidota bacterium]